MSSITTSDPSCSNTRTGKTISSTKVSSTNTAQSIGVIGTARPTRVDRGADGADSTEQEGITGAASMDS